MGRKTKRKVCCMENHRLGFINMKSGTTSVKSYKIDKQEK